MVDILIAFAVVAALPGINCGACGYKGCDDYAAALAEGKASASLCVPGAADVATALASLLGVEVAPQQSTVAFVQCNRCHTQGLEVNTYEGILSCKAAAMLYGGPEACANACLGLGDCAAACPAQAICLRDGLAHIDATRCIGCGLCAASCPKHVIRMLPSDAAVVVMCSNREKGALARKKCTNACIGCKKCEKACPNGALTVQGDLATIDYEKCSGCGLCVKACPVGCLHQVRSLDARDGE